MHTHHGDEHLLRQGKVFRPELRADEFSAFFRAVHGYDPFPWQARLANSVFTTGWPKKALDVPTGAGKTAPIDIAVFHLALEADRGPERRAPARILFVVDRRLIVDDAYDRAKTIADKIVGAGNDVLDRVASRLRWLAEDGRPPLVVEISEPVLASHQHGGHARGAGAARPGRDVADAQADAPVGGAMRLPEGPQFRNQPQDAGKQISRDGGLGHLEGGIAAVADDLRSRS